MEIIKKTGSFLHSDFAETLLQIQKEPNGPFFLAFSYSIPLVTEIV